MKSESEVTQSCPTLRDPMDCSLPGSSAHGIFQARVLEWGATAFSKLLLSNPLFNACALLCLLAQFCLTLSDVMDYSPSGSSVHGIFQARVLERGTIVFSVYWDIADYNVVIVSGE